MTYERITHTLCAEMLGVRADTSFGLAGHSVISVVRKAPSHTGALIDVEITISIQLGSEIPRHVAISSSQHPLHMCRLKVQITSV